MVNKFFVRTRCAQFVNDFGLPKTCAADVEVGLMDLLDEHDEAKNIRILEDWLEQRPHLRSPELHRSPLDHETEARAFGKSPTMRARAELLNKYGSTMYAERLSAWGSSAQSLKPGIEPGRTSERSTGTKASPLDHRDSNNPFNPNRRYKDDDARRADIVKFIMHFGPKAAAAAASRYGCDLAGRPLRSRF